MFAVLVLWLRHVALPNVDGYRDRVVSSIEKASGMTVGVRAIHGQWEGLRPALSLEGLTLSDRRGKAAFQLERAEVTVSWWWLALGQLRFYDVDFYRPDLELRRGADGLIYLADKPLNQAGAEDDGAFTEWLLSQRRVGVHQATLTWRDDFMGAPPVRLTNVEIGVRKRLGHHRAALTATPPRELASAIDLRADVVLRREGGKWLARGESYAETRDADLARLRSHLPMPETLRSAFGSVRVWLRFGPRGLDEVVADLDVRDARARLAADALPLELATISGRLIYHTLADGFSFATEKLRFRLASGVEVQPGNFNLSRTQPASGPPRVEIRGDNIDIKIAATLVDYFPLPRDVKNRVLRFAPRGRIREAQMVWSDDGARTYQVKGRFEDLAINTVDAVPGLEGLSGSVEGSEGGGILRLASKQSRVDLPLIFRKPLAFEALEVQARWKHVGTGLEVSVEQARAANADAEMRFSGLWRSLPQSPNKSPGYVDLKGTIHNARAVRAADYLPNNLAPTRQWLETALQGGSSNKLDFEIKGDLWEFPFGGESTGNFLVQGDVREGKLRYHPDWPAVEGIEGSLRFHNRRMEIAASRATIFASRVKAATAVIGDLLADPPVLTIDSEIDTTGSDSVRFLRESPLVNGPGAFTRAVSVEGPARLKLHIDYPLWGTQPVRVAGDYAFAGATASVARTLAMREVRGRLAFTEKGVSAPELSGSLFGKPAVLAIASQPGGPVLTTIEGRIDGVVLGAYVPEPIASRLSGAVDWKARVLTGDDGVQLTITSDLKGIASTLPEPLAKRAEEARPLTISMARLGQESEVTTAALEGGVFGRFHRLGLGGEERWKAAIKFGSALAGEPVREGLWLYGELARGDVDAWQAVFAPPVPAPVATAPPPAAERGAGFELRGVDMALGRGRYLGREFQQMRASLTRDRNQWSGTLASPLIAGRIDWNGEGRGRLVAKLERFAIPEVAPGTQPAAPGEQPDLPAIDLEAARFDFRGRPLGNLVLKAEPAGTEWRIDRLDITAGNSKFTSTGASRKTGAGAITTLAVKLEAADLNALFNIFGYGDYLKRGAGHLDGTLAWPGVASEFALDKLSGSLKVEARGGQFAKIEPGAGKLLGLLSLQSLPRRALFDFRDVFSDGFAFDKIEGDVKVARGILITDEFSISGPSAYVTLSGEVSMPLETQALTMKVVPEVGEGMALAATVFGTPVLGLSTLLMSKLLRNPLGKAVSYEYQVTGSWDNPQVTRTSAPPPRTVATQPPAPAATTPATPR